MSACLPPSGPRAGGNDPQTDQPRGRRQLLVVSNQRVDLEPKGHRKMDRISATKSPRRRRFRRPVPGAAVHALRLRTPSERQRLRRDLCRAGRTARLRLGHGGPEVGFRARTALRDQGGSHLIVSASARPSHLSLQLRPGAHPPAGANGGGPVIVHPSGSSTRCSAATSSGVGAPCTGGSDSNPTASSRPVSRKNVSKPAGVISV